MWGGGERGGDGVEGVSGEWWEVGGPLHSLSFSSSSLSSLSSSSSSSFTAVGCSASHKNKTRYSPIVRDEVRNSHLCVHACFSKLLKLCF